MNECLVDEAIFDLFERLACDLYASTSDDCLCVEEMEGKNWKDINM